MIYTFTCPTIGCENNTNPVYLLDPTNPVLCSLCGAYGDAVETEEPAPTPTPEETPKATKAK
jgi:hypothetical protein